MSLFVGNSSRGRIVLHLRGRGMNPMPFPALEPGGQIEVTTTDCSDLMSAIARNGGIDASAAPAGFAGLLYSSAPIPAAQLGPMGWPAPYPPPRQMVTTWP